MAKVAVTGGAGFIGSHLAEELASQDHRVTILDDLSTGSMKNIEHLLQSRRGDARFVQGSVTDLPLLRELLQGIDYVFHQAALPSVLRSIQDPVASHRVNVTGTLNVLIAAQDNSVKKVVYASSSSVYGDTATLPKSEEMAPKPLSPYAATKLAAEYYCCVFQEVYGLPTACLRYFNVYGPRQDPLSPYAAVIPSFIKKIAQGDPPIVFGDGEQSRDFTFIKDVVAANLLAAESDACGVFNIGTGQRTTISELARIMIEMMGYQGEPIYEGPSPGDIRHSLADISRASGFGYRPKYDIVMGLKETVKEIKRWHQIQARP